MNTTLRQIAFLGWLLVLGGCSLAHKMPDARMTVTATDSGVVQDDAAIEVDANVVVDAGVTTDSAVPDADAIEDLGVIVAMDAGLADAGAEMDASVEVDAALEADLGVTTDAGIAYNVVDGSYVDFDSAIALTNESAFLTEDVLPLAGDRAPTVAISGDGNTVAFGETEDESGSLGINGNPRDGSARGSGAVYVFVRRGNEWESQAYIKASNHTSFFGQTISLSFDGNTLAVTAAMDNSCATGVNDFTTTTTCTLSDAAYVFHRTGSSWAQQAYLKRAPSSTELERFVSFGALLSADGNKLVAFGETIVGLPVVTTFVRNEDHWALADRMLTDVAIYPEAGGGPFWNTASNQVALSSDGSTFALGSLDSNDIAIYVAHLDNTWSLSTVLHSADFGDFGSYFGTEISLSHDGRTIAVTQPEVDVVHAPSEYSASVWVACTHIIARVDSGWIEQGLLWAPRRLAGVDPTQVLLSDAADVLIVTAIAADSDSGYVLAYTKTGDSWNALTELGPSWGDGSERLGAKVAMNADGTALATSANLYTDVGPLSGAMVFSLPH